jgi:L-amino acid N-acyltransferase YncA
MDDFALRPVVLADAESLARIYNRYIASSTITFEKTPLETGDVEGRIGETIESFPWLVY